MASVIGGDNSRGLRTIEVRTPIRHDSVTAVGRIAFPPVPHNLVKRDRLEDWVAVQAQDERRSRRERVDAGRHTLEMEGALPYGVG